MKRYIILLFIFIMCMPAFAEDSWWKHYGDDILISNLEKLYVNNPDLKIASIKTKQMQEVIKMSVANELPQINFDANIGRELRSSDIHFGEVMIPNYSQTRYLLPLSMSYEIDLYGKNHLQTKSYRRLSDIVLQDEKMSKILISSAFSANYFNLIKTDSLIQNVKELLNIQSKIVEMQNIKYEKGLCGKSSVLSEEQLLAVYKEDLNNLMTSQELFKNQLISMLGDKTVIEVERGRLENLCFFDIPDSFDSSVITKRPDFIKSELYVKKTGLDVRVARRELLPSFILYGDIGFNAYHLNKMFAGHSFLSGVGVLPSWDVFAGGRKMANLRYKKLECKRAVESYNKTVLTSLQELNDSLCRVKNSYQNYDESVKRNILEKEKFSLTSRKLDIGAISELDKLKEQRNLYLSQNDVINQKISYLITTIELYKALGGEDYSENISL